MLWVSGSSYSLSLLLLSSFLMTFQIALIR
uniref:Uncharacterized protein n=1 Tax=Rhizophora mucronata TaxID=61149 RepID=A0A2P2PXW0_RHIMU